MIRSILITLLSLISSAIGFSQSIEYKDTVVAGTYQKIIIHYKEGTLIENIKVNGRSIDFDYSKFEVEYMYKVAMRPQGNIDVEINYKENFQPSFTKQATYVIRKPIAHIAELDGNEDIKFQKGKEVLVHVTCKDLGKIFQPHLALTGGSVRKSEKSAHFYITPSSEKLIISISTGGQRLATMIYKVQNQRK